jgi:hypothetical protein
MPSADKDALTLRQTVALVLIVSGLVSLLGIVARALIEVLK